MFATRTVFPRLSNPSLLRPRPSSQVARQIQQARAAHSRYSYSRPRPQYNRFSRAQQLYVLWRTSPAFRTGVGATGVGAGAFYVYNLEEVPVSGRRRFNCVSPSTEQSTAQQMYQQTLQEFGHKVLPPWHPQVKMVQRVLDRLIPQSGLHDQEWEVHVIDDQSQLNAFVIPGGKVFVFSGILPICDGEDGLAAVLGHEIAHNVAHHAAERMSQTVLAIPIAYAASYVFDVSGSISQLLLDYAFLRPGSRKQELEADYIGLMMMAESCFDPVAAARLWARMEEAEKVAIPQFISTHPSNHNRLGMIQKWLPEAESKRAESGCANTIGYVDDFRKAFRNESLW